MKTLEFKWTVSRGRDTYGYNICTLYVDGVKVAACNGGGYDMKGTCLGNWIARAYANRLFNLPLSAFPEKTHWEGTFSKGKTVSDGKMFYGLTYHDPNFDPGKAVIGKDCSDRTFSGKSEGKTVEQAEKDGDTVGLERYQAFYSASSKTPTKRHTVPLIDGACGFSSVEKIASAIGLSFEWIKTRSSKLDLYRVHDARELVAAAVERERAAEKAA